MYTFELEGNELNTYEVYLVSNYHTDKYIFKAESEYSIKEYLVKECCIFKKSNMSINEIFDFLKNNKRSWCFTFASGRYYYLKEIRLIEDEIIEDEIIKENNLYINRLCIIS